MWNLFQYPTLRHSKYKSTKMDYCCFFKAKCQNSLSIWQVNEIQNKRVQSCRSTIILVLDSITSVLYFVNCIKASFMKKLGFPDTKSLPRRGEKCGMKSPHAQSFNLFVLLTCKPNGWDKLYGYRKFKGKAGFMKVKEISQTILLQIFKSVNFNLSLELIDTYCYN